MHPQRKKRLLLLAAALAVITLASTLILNAFRSNLVFFHTPSEVASKQVATDRTLRIGGLVAPGSIQRSAGGLQVSFAVTDQVHSVPVRYQGILPDLFNEGKGTVVQGVLGADGVFQASQVLAKHDENYMPPEAADALERAGQTVVQP